MDLAFLTLRTELSSLLGIARTKYGGYQVLDHWTQGEFHHDVVVKIARPEPDLPGDILVLGTNCNGGIKEVLCFGEVPDRWALWHFRCPANPEFTGELPKVLGSTRTKIWYDPCGLLGEDGPSELKPEFRERVRGGRLVRNRIKVAQEPVGTLGAVRPNPSLNPRPTTAAVVSPSCGVHSIIAVRAYAACLRGRG